MVLVCCRRGGAQCSTARSSFRWILSCCGACGTTALLRITAPTSSVYAKPFPLCSISLPSRTSLAHGRRSVFCFLRRIRRCSPRFLGASRDTLIHEFPPTTTLTRSEQTKSVIPTTTDYH